MEDTYLPRLLGPKRSQETHAKESGGQHMGLGAEASSAWCTEGVKEGGWLIESLTSSNKKH